MFVALVIQHAKLMLHIVLSSVACPALLQFSTLSHKSKRQDFRRNVTECKMSALILSSKLFLNHFSFFEELSEILSYMYIGLPVQYFMYSTSCTVLHVQYYVYSTSCTVPEILVRIHLNFFDKFVNTK